MVFAFGLERLKGLGYRRRDGSVGPNRPRLGVTGLIGLGLW